MFDWTIGTLGICLIGTGISVAYRRYAVSLLDKSAIKKVDNLFFAAFAVRILWYIVYFGFIADKYPFMVSDDYSYYYEAVGSSSKLSAGRNNYQTFLNYLYHLFGVSSFNGRLVNLFASALCVFPIAYIENALAGDKNRFFATKVYCFAPFMVTICSFEIKDILSMLFFSSSCMVMIYMQKTGSMKRILALLIFCILSEIMRSGMGLLVFGVFGCSIFYKWIGGSSQKKGRKLFAFTCICSLMVCAVIVLMSTEYYQDTIFMLGQYMAGRDQSINPGSLFDFLTIDSIGEIWKLPLDLIFYITLPSASEHVGRFMFDFGVYCRIFDMPVALLGVYWIIRNCRKFGFYSICVIVPYVYLACFQIITFREVIFIVPLLYIAAADYLFPKRSEAKGTVMVRAGHVRVSYRVALLIAIYLVWLAFVLIKVR